MTPPTSEPTPPTSEPMPPMPTAPQPHELKDVPWPQVVMSSVGLVCWILLYAAGLLMESVEERILLAPHTMEKQLGPNGKDLVADVVKQAKLAEEQRGKKPKNESDKHNAESKAAPSEPKGNEVAKESGTGTEKTPAVVASQEPGKKCPTEITPDKVEAKKESLLATRQPVSRVTAFFYSVLVYTPTNMALLTLFAGLLGGCVSNIKYSMMTNEERANLKPKEEAILSENPLSATMRGFVIYLCMVAGLYVVLDDPFKDSTPGQYARLAGSMSLVAFIVGFDPTRIKAWLRMADSKSGSDSGSSQAGPPAKT